MPVKRACHICGRASEDAYCPEHRDEAKAAKRARWRPGRGTAADRELTLAVLERDGYVCHLCGKGPAEGAPADSKDHVIPYSKGGPTTMDNLAAAHLLCNQQKGDRTS